MAFLPCQSVTVSLARVEETKGDLEGEQEERHSSKDVSSAEWELPGLSSFDWLIVGVQEEKKETLSTCFVQIDYRHT